MTNHDERSVQESVYGEFWIGATDSKPGWWTDDEIDVNHARENGRVVLEAVDGRIEGVTGSAHLADVMNLTGRVQELEQAMTTVLDVLRNLGGVGQKILHSWYEYEQVNSR